METHPNVGHWQFSVFYLGRVERDRNRSCFPALTGMEDRKRRARQLFATICGPSAAQRSAVDDLDLGLGSEAAEEMNVAG